MDSEMHLDVLQARLTRRARAKRESLSEQKRPERENSPYLQRAESRMLCRTSHYYFWPHVHLFHHVPGLHVLKKKHFFHFHDYVCI
jgi:hypothetical protein